MPHPSPPDQHKNPLVSFSFAGMAWGNSLLDTSLVNKAGRTVVLLGTARSYSLPHRMQLTVASSMRRTASKAQLTAERQPLPPSPTLAAAALST
mmetsp:Transcript_72515/g.121540  ORF Transcript_72515/g.121540 Transcript_72515/m.121540 type:complete len:94 (-) Transcript_72515:485-766(-)